MKVKIATAIIIVLVIGILIPKLTVRDSIPVDERLQRCVNYAIKETYDNPIERIALLLGESKIVETDWKGSVSTESYTLFRIPMRGSLTVFCDQEGIPQESSFTPTNQWTFVDGMEVEYLGVFHDSSIKNGLKSYQSDRLDVSLKYPENFRLFEGKGLGVGGVEYYVITMFPEPYISEILASDADTEWPASMHLSFFRNTDMLPLEEWIRTKRYSNFVPSDPAQEGVLIPTTVAGVPALVYHVSGLYESDYIAFKYGEWVVLAVADDMGKNTEQDFETMLASIELES